MAIASWACSSAALSPWEIPEALQVAPSHRCLGSKRKIDCLRLFFVIITGQHGPIAQNQRFYPHPRCPSTRNLPAPPMPMYPKFIRTLVFLPAIHPHPRFFYTRNISAPSFFFTRNLLAPSFFYPKFNRTLVFFTRNLPAPVAFAARHYPANRETLRPCIPATRAARVPVGRWCMEPVAPAARMLLAPATVPAPRLEAEKPHPGSPGPAPPPLRPGTRTLD